MHVPFCLWMQCNLKCRFTYIKMETLRLRCVLMDDSHRKNGRQWQHERVFCVWLLMLLQWSWLNWSTWAISWVFWAAIRQILQKEVHENSALITNQERFASRTSQKQKMGWLIFLPKHLIECNSWSYAEWIRWGGCWWSFWRVLLFEICRYLLAIRSDCALCFSLRWKALLPEAVLNRAALPHGRMVMDNAKRRRQMALGFAGITIHARPIHDRSRSFQGCEKGSIRDHLSNVSCLVLHVDKTQLDFSSPQLTRLFFIKNIHRSWSNGFSFSVLQSSTDLW